MKPGAKGYIDERTTSDQIMFSHIYILTPQSMSGVSGPSGYESPTIHISTF